MLTSISETRQIKKRNKGLTRGQLVQTIQFSIPISNTGLEVRIMSQFFASQHLVFRELLLLNMEVSFSFHHRHSRAMNKFVSSSEPGLSCYNVAINDTPDNILFSNPFFTAVGQRRSHSKTDKTSMSGTLTDLQSTGTLKSLAHDSLLPPSLPQSDRV